MYIIRRTKYLKIWWVTFTTIHSKFFTFFTQFSWVSLFNIRFIQSLWFFEWRLDMWIDIYFARLTLLTHVGPGVGWHPTTFTFWAFELPETTVTSLINCFISTLKNVVLIFFMNTFMHSQTGISYIHFIKSRWRI